MNRNTITVRMRMWVSVGITIIIIGGGITTGIICVRIKMGIRVRLTVGFTVSVAVQVTTLKRTVISAHYCWKMGQTDV
jgi:hypothetical protein